MSQKFEFVKILPKGSSPGLSEQELPDLMFSREETAWTRFSSSLVSLHEVFIAFHLWAPGMLSVSLGFQSALWTENKVLCVFTVLIT